jgi:hypothetical protein
MTRDNFEIALRAFVRRRPFQPFLIEFHSGDNILVTHPEALRLQGDVCQYVTRASLNCLFDSSSVSRLRDPDPPNAGTGV